MKLTARPTSSRWAIVLLGAAVLMLAGCGRKGPLDLPPNSTAQSAAPASVQGDTEAQRAATPSVFNSTYGSEAQPTAPKGAKRSFILDPLLGN